MQNPAIMNLKLFRVFLKTFRHCWCFPPTLVATVMMLRPIKIENCPQFYTATILDWKQLLKPEKYKMVIMASLQ